ncbi:MAG: hypothetical protein UU98_C0012G0012 [Parcubacteria group bacterium GW2011_GWD2_42_14]|nr:MAG: hypothetical protein UU98_C0012G0012 [Parcubacteria group bacterium GW2011_GWD2_42_14]
MLGQMLKNRIPNPCPAASLPSVRPGAMKTTASQSCRSVVTSPKVKDRNFPIPAVTPKGGASGGHPSPVPTTATNPFVLYHEGGSTFFILQPQCG